MANGIKIGNLDVSSFKVGSADCKVYLGDVQLYPQDSPTTIYQIEYLESSGSQYIDTGVYLNTSNFEVGYTVVGDRGCWGYAHQNVVKGAWVTVSNDYAYMGQWDDNCKVDVSPYLSQTETTIVYTQSGVTVNGTTLSMYLNLSGIDNLNDSTLLFFAWYDFYRRTAEVNFNSKFKSFYVKNNGVLVRDMIPVRVGDVGYMYDRVSGELFGNEGSGSFILGPDVDYTKQYLTFEPISSAVTFSNATQNFNYSLDYGLTWTTVSRGYTVTANVGQKMMVKGNFGAGPNDNNGNKFITSGGTWKAYGNVLSLVASDDFQSRTAVNANQLINLFRDCTALVDVDNLKMPAYTAGSTAIRGMFRNCSSLVHVPSDLLSTFTAFTSDATAMGMFEDCYSLLETPIIPNMSVGGYGLYGMFNNCTSLTACTCLLTDANISGTKTQDLLNGVNTQNGIFYKNPDTTWSSSAISNAKIPSGWAIRNYTPTSYTYSVTITGLENGDTTRISWNFGDHVDSNVGNGTYTYTTTADTISVNLDMDGLSDYTVDYDHFTLYNGDSQTVTFTHQQTSYTYSVTIQGLENGDTTTIWWDATRDIHTDSNVGNGTYTYTTTADTISVNLDISGLSDYTVDHYHFTLSYGGSWTVTFTYQGGGGLESIPYGTDMSQYYNRYIKRIVIGDGTLAGNQCYINNWGQSSYISIASWGVSGFGEFSGITSLPIDSTPSNPVQLELWEYTDSNWSTTNTNPFNDLQIEWA